MKPTNPNLKYPPPPHDRAKALRSLIVYDDFSTAARARDFVSTLLRHLGSPCLSHDSLWHIGMFAQSGRATTLALTAAESDFVILALRGDRELPDEAKAWLECCLPLAGGRGVTLVALFETVNANAKHVRATRLYLREKTSKAGVDFFAHCSNAPEMMAAPARSEEETEHETPASAQTLRARRWPISHAA